MGDLITESMAAGDFENLKGAGKPLPERRDYSPHTDPTTNKMNEILVETGFVPDWVQLQKDIRERKVHIRKELAELRQRLGPEPLSQANLQRWSDNCDRIERAEIFPLNKKIEQ